MGMLVQKSSALVTKLGLATAITMKCCSKRPDSEVAEAFAHEIREALGMWRWCFCEIEFSSYCCQKFHASERLLQECVASMFLLKQ